MGLGDPNMPYDPALRDTDQDNEIDSEDHGLDRECDWNWGDADFEDWANPGHQY